MGGILGALAALPSVRVVFMKNRSSARVFIPVSRINCAHYVFLFLFILCRFGFLH